MAPLPVGIRPRRSHGATRDGGKAGLTPWRYVLALVFVLSFSLDFKGVEGGSPIQLAMAFHNTMAFALLGVSYRFVHPIRGLPGSIFWGWAIFLLVATMVAILHGVPVDRYVRVAYPFLLFLEGFLVAWWIGRDFRGAEILVSGMLATAIVSLLFSFWWGFHFSGLGVGEIRYQVLSPLIPFIFCASTYDLFFARRRRTLSASLVVAMSAIVVLSVTRGLLLIFGIMAIVILFVAVKNVLFVRLSIPKPIVLALLWVTAFSVIGAVALSAIFPDAVERWTHRASGVLVAVTAWTRYAAVIGQLRALGDSPLGWLTGLGFGSSYAWPVWDFPWIAPYLGRVLDQVWFPGEFMWVPFVFYGGAIAGTVAALVLVLSAIHAFRVLGQLFGEKRWRDPAVRPVWISAMSFTAYLAMGLTANPFILRLAALQMGLSLGLLLAQTGGNRGGRFSLASMRFQPQSAKTRFLRTGKEV